MVLAGRDLGLGVGVVVGAVRSRGGLGDAEVGQQHRDRLGGHRGAAAGLDGQLVTRDALGGDGLGEQPLGQRGAVWFGDQPAGT